MVSETEWKQVMLLLTAGVVGATQLAKVAIAAPLLRVDPGASLVVLGWIAGAYSIIGVVGSLMVGFVGASLPLRRLVVAGLLILAGSSALGSVATSSSWLTQAGSSRVSAFSWSPWHARRSCVSALSLAITRSSWQPGQRTSLWVEPSSCSSGLWSWTGTGGACGYAEHWRR